MSAPSSLLRSVFRFFACMSGMVAIMSLAQALKASDPRLAFIAEALSTAMAWNAWNLVLLASVPASEAKDGAR